MSELLFCIKRLTKEGPVGTNNFFKSTMLISTNLDELSMDEKFDIRVLLIDGTTFTVRIPVS